jgi:hypothetical protein
MTDFSSGLTTGGGDELIQRFDTWKEAGFALYSLGLYAQDEWRVSPKLKVTLSLRADRNSNESCQVVPAVNAACFSRATGAFAPADINTPYNQTVVTGLSSAFPSVEAVAWQPRVGFAYSPRGDKTVFRGGIGLFSDLYPGQLAEAFASNMPYTASFTAVADGALYAPGVPGSIYSVTSGSDAALLSGFAAGQTYAQMQANGLLSRPQLTVAPNNFSNPKYLEWNFQVEQQLDAKTALTVNYVGNHGYDLLLVDPAVNWYCNPAICSLTSIFPATRPDGRFGRVLQYTNNGLSYYNGMTATFTRRMTKGFTGSLNYTWSHSLDNVSNGGLDPYSRYDPNGYITSFQEQISPTNPKGLNYGDSDNDFRHMLSVSYVWELPFKASHGVLNGLVNGWSVSGTLFARSAVPFTPYWAAADAGLGNTSGSADYIFGSYSGSNFSCGGPKNASSAGLTCFDATNSFADPTTQTTLGSYRRNAFRGPGYFNTDMSILKKFKIYENVAFSLGLDFYNILNHPNFQPPETNLGAGNAGQYFMTATPPSSPYGNFQGSAVSGRVIQTLMKFEF